MTSTLGLSLCVQTRFTSVVAIVAIADSTSHFTSHTQLRERRSSDETLYPALCLLCIRTHHIPPNRKYPTMNKRTRFALLIIPIKMRLRNHTMWFLEQCLMKLDIDKYQRSNYYDVVDYPNPDEFTYLELDLDELFGDDYDY